MNLIDSFQDLVAQVPDIIQPLIVALAGAVPFIEGEGAVTIGILGGIHPVVAAIAAMLGNFLCVAALVLLSSGARRAIVDRSRTRTTVAAGGGSSTAGESTARVEEASPRARKFQHAFERYGVPGVSLLGPLLLPTQFTATMLAASGVGRTRILIWQAAAIMLWTTAFALLVSGVFAAVG